ncbi:MAG: hypothetical protein R2684_07655 [Pyrinomonadaceae bacterium]
MRTLPLIIVFAVIVLATPLVASAQIEEQCPQLETISPRPRRGNEQTGLREQIIKLCIKEIKKDHEELVENTEKLALLTAEIKEAFDNDSQTLTAENKKRIEKAQDLIKKVRSELKAEDDDEEAEESKPASVGEAVSSLNDTSQKLLEEVKKTTRHSISIVAIETSNAVMRIVRFLRVSF